MKFVTDVTDPYLNIFRRFLPPVRIGPGALDLSPIVATFVLLIVSEIIADLDPGGEPVPAAALAPTAGLVVALDQATKQLVDTRIDRGDQVGSSSGST